MTKKSLLGFAIALCTISPLVVQAAEGGASCQTQRSSRGYARALHAINLRQLQMTPRRTDGQTVDVDVSFGNVVDDLKPSGMVFFTAKKGRLGFAAVVQYAEIEAPSKTLEPLLSRGTLRSTSFVLSALALLQSQTWPRGLDL